MKNYRAYVISEENGNFQGEFKNLPLKGLLKNQVLIKVIYSSINYKDYLSTKGNKGITKNYPHVPGIDLAGVIEKSNYPNLNPKQEGLVTGYDLGMNTPGGWAEYAIVPGDWVVPLPTGLSLKEAMILGTAGFTAAQSVEALEKFSVINLKNETSKIIVSGASGGVGSVAVRLLDHLNYSVVALTRDHANDDFLKSLGAKECLTLKEWENKLNPKKPLEKSLWSGAIDTVGGKVLEKILKCLQYHSVVTCCGMVGGIGLNTTVFPFILRGIKLIGIDSAEQPLSLKKALWQTITQKWKIPDLEKLYQEISFSDLSTYVNQMEKGEIQGRIIIKI